MDLNIKIKKCTLLITNGSDELIFETEMPDTQWPFEDNLQLKTILANGTGADYLAKNFPEIEYEIVDVSVRTPKTPEPMTFGTLKK